MISRLLRRPAALRTFVVVSVAAACTSVTVVSAAAQDDTGHGRKFKPLPPTSHITVTVEKGFNGKPLMNAAVIFHATREGHNDGNLEVKTDEDGKAVIDVIEVGSHVTVQVIANGFATSAQDIDVDGATKDLLVKMIRPRAQISDYQNNDGQASELKPGVQEPPHPVKPAKPTTAPTVTPAATPQPTGTGAPQ